MRKRKSESEKGQRLRRREGREGGVRGKGRAREGKDCEAERERERELSSVPPVGNIDDVVKGDGACVVSPVDSCLQIACASSLPFLSHSSFSSHSPIRNLTINPLTPCIRSRATA